MSKVRRIDWSPDEYMGGTFGKLTAEEHGVYIVILNMIYSFGGPIEADWKRIGHAIRARPQAAQRIVGQLMVKGKLRLSTDGRITNGRAELELDRAEHRIEGQRLGGQNSWETRSKPRANPEQTGISNRGLLKVSEKSLAENNELGRSDLRITNHQPSTINHHDHTASNNTVAASAAGDPGGPPRSPAPSPDPSVPPTKLTSEETWRQRLAGYDPSRPRQTWKPFWGPTPDAAGHQPLIPKDLLRWWREGREHAAD